MLDAAVGAVWSGARGWLTPPVLFVFVNLVIGTIAVMSKLMSSSAAAAETPGAQRSLMRAPSVAFDRFRCFSFSRLGIAAEHAPAPQYAPFDDDAAAEAPMSGHVQPAPGGFERRTSFLRAPSFALDRLRGFSFSRREPAADDHAPVTTQPPPSDDAADAKPSPLRPAPVEARMEMESEPAPIERSQSEAAAVAPARRRRARKTRKPAREEPALAEADAGSHLLPPPVEVDARADDFIRQFREQLRLQRLDSILRYKDTLRRTGTA